MRKKEPESMLLEAMVFGASGAIERQEAQGQQEFVESEMLPVEHIGPGGGEAQLREMGFSLGDVDESDGLFRAVTLPDGWKKEPTEHPMWSEIKDAEGRVRVMIFYKAAFYDRKAHYSIKADE